MRTKLTVLFSLFILSLSGYSNELDSLKTLLQGTSDEEQRALIQLEIAWKEKHEDVYQSIATTEESMEILKAKNNEEGIAIGKSYLGVYMYLLDSIPQAVEQLAQAIEYFEKENLELRLTRVYNNLGLCYSALHNNEKALEYYQKCLRIKEKYPEKADITNNIINIAAIYYDQGRYEKCIEEYEKALIAALKKNDLRTTAIVYSNLGATYERIGDIPTSIDYLLKAISIYRNQLKNDDALIRSYLNLGSTYMSNDELDKARYYYTLALELNSEANKVGTYAVIYNNLGELERKSGNIKTAEKYTLDALKIATETNYLEEREIALHELSMIYEEMDKMNLALDYYKEYIRFGDSLLREERSESIQRALIQHQLDIDKMILEKEEKLNAVVSKKVNSMIGAFYFWIGLVILWGLLHFNLFSSPDWLQKLLNYFVPLFGGDLIVMYTFLKTDYPSTAAPSVLLAAILIPVLLSGVVYLFISREWKKTESK